MDKVEFSVFRTEIEAQIKIIEKIYKEISSRRLRARRDQIALESLAYKLHNLYCAFEDLFKIVARRFENQIENHAQYHKELLRRMALDIRGVRPSLISEELLKDLDELRAFRYFFRHAYSYEINYEKIRVALKSALKVKKKFKKDIKNFVKEIKGQLRS